MDFVFILIRSSILLDSCVLFHQLLQTVAGKAYRELSILAIAFATQHRSAAIFGMPDGGAGTEASGAARRSWGVGCGLWDGDGGGGWAVGGGLWGGIGLGNHARRSINAAASSGIRTAEDVRRVRACGINAVLVGEIAFLKDRPAFQRIFGYLHEMQEQAAATFQLVTGTLRIVGLDIMTGVVTSSPAMLGKMASIQRKLEKYPKYKAALTMSNLVKFIGSHPECGVDVSGIGDEAQLVFQNDPQHRFKILKLLDDDYLRSQLTEMDYEANSKGAPVVR